VPIQGYAPVSTPGTCSCEQSCNVQQKQASVNTVGNHSALCVLKLSNISV